MSQLVRREQIIDSFANYLKTETSILALYQCGSAAFKRLDEWSDIDFIILVEDGMIEQTFKIIDKYVGSQYQIKASYGEFLTSWPGVWEKVYTFKDESPFHMIEVAIIEKSSSVSFTEKEIHGEIVVHFDRVEFTQPTPINLALFSQKLKQRIIEISKLHEIYHVLPKKEINRKNAIEAYAFYYRYSLQPYLELLRIMHCPFRHAFGTRYVYYDFPKYLIDSLEPYYFVANLKTLEKYVYEIHDKTTGLLEELDSLDLISHLENHR